MGRVKAARLSAGLSGAASNIKIGPDGNVYVSGTFVSAGGVTTDGTAYWDGLRWNAFGRRLISRFVTLRLHRTEPSTPLSAPLGGPNFTTFLAGDAGRIGMGQSGTSRRLPNIPQWKCRRQSGNVYVAGAAVQTINGNAVTGNGGLAHIVMWDGTEWSIPGDGVDNVVMVIHRRSTISTSAASSTKPVEHPPADRDAGRHELELLRTRFSG
ncbi:MAG: hypothetical protein R2832_15040 [Rhodothermales bacterium]